LILKIKKNSPLEKRQAQKNQSAIFFAPRCYKTKKINGIYQMNSIFSIELNYVKKNHMAWQRVNGPA